MLSAVRQLVSRPTVNRAIFAIKKANFGSHAPAASHNTHGDFANELRADDIRNQPFDMEVFKNSPESAYKSFCSAQLEKNPDLAKLTKGQFMIKMREISHDDHFTIKCAIFSGLMIFMFYKFVLAQPRPVHVAPKN